MMNRTLVIVAVLAMVGSAGNATAGNHWDDDREFNYIGHSGITEPLCDHTDGYLGNGYHIGGARFCGVSKGTTVRVTIDDAVVTEPSAMVSCVEVREEGPFPNEDLPLTTWTVEIHKILAEANPSATINVPEDCLESDAEGAPGGSTDLYVFIHGGWGVGCYHGAGTVTLRFL